MLNGNEAMNWKDRARELRHLRHTNPAALIALYRAATDRDELNSLPAGVSFALMIDAIIDRERLNAPAEREPPHAAGAA